jgi:hypothetical protein
MEFFSPENVSERIFNFAIRGFENFVGQSHNTSSSEARGAYVDYIKPAIESGFEQARHLLEPVLNDDVSDIIDETFDLVEEKLDLFIGYDVNA